MAKITLKEALLQLGTILACLGQIIFILLIWIFLIDYTKANSNDWNLFQDITFGIVAVAHSIISFIIFTDSWAVVLDKIENGRKRNKRTKKKA